MELGVYLKILWRRKWVVVITTVVTMTVVVIGTLAMTPVYEASTTVRVIDYDAWYAERLLNTLAKITTSGSVLAELEQQLGFGELDDLIEIKVEIMGNTELMEIIIESPDPVLSAQAANTLAEILVVQSRLDTRIRGNTLSVDPAVVPKEPSRPHRVLNFALGFAIGLAGGVGLVFLFENLDTTLYTLEQIEQAAQAPILGQMPTVRKRRQLTTFDGRLPYREAIRYLRTNILALDDGKSLQTLVVTSAELGEGKSTMVANLAVIFGQLERSVIAVDSDLRRPTLHQMFDLSSETGLSNVLRQEATLEKAVQNSSLPGVHVLASGPLPPNPAELLGSSEMVALIEQLTRRFDIVLLDTPALLAVTDATILAQLVDGVILVVGRAQTRREAVGAACRRLANVKARLIGVAVNRAEPETSYYYY